MALYKALDKRCESLTARERRIGEFAKAVPQSLLLGRGGSITASDQRTVRIATPNDVPAMMALERQTPCAAHWNADIYREIFNDEAPRRFAFVCGAECGLLNGFLVARFDADSCELENMVVAEAVQRQGIGFDLVQRLRTTIRQLGGHQIMLEVRESNRAARGLYEKSGFQISGGRRAYYKGPQEDAILYTLKL